MNIEKIYRETDGRSPVMRRISLFRQHWFANLRLRNKLFIIFLLVSFIPCSVLIYYSYTSTRDTITEQTYASLSGTLNQINTNLENRLGYYEQLTNILYMDAQLRNFLSNDYEQAFYYLDAFQYINRTMSSMLISNANIQGITIYIDNKTLYSDKQYIKYTEELPDTVKQQALNAAGSPVYTHIDDPQTGASYVTLARSLSYFSLMHPYGILTINIDDKEIYSLIEKENVNKSVYIIDSDGRVISSGDTAMKGRQLFDVYPIQADLTLSGGKFDTRIDGQERFFTYKKLSNGWTTVITVPYDELLANTNKATKRIVWISVTVIAVAALLIFFTAKVITKRIEVLLQQIRKVERGNFQVKRKPMGNDEIGQLSYAFQKMTTRIQELIDEVYVKEIAVKDSELTTLQAQINPHFLYNTLSSISSLALKEGSTQVYQMVSHLSKYYRISLNKGKRVVLLEQEIQLVKNYVSIQEIRFRGMLHMHYDLDESLFNRTVIKLILQPFIENCINHAIWNEAGIHIIVKLKGEGDDLLLQVIDDGQGMTRERLEEAFSKASNQSGYGIKNVDDRIKLAYGEHYGVEIFSRLGIGTNVTIRLPLNPNASDLETRLNMG
ncbi:putative sensor-like histidine kinase [compost metagenome]|uniref:histidine kinase n=1 Tax=Paenibacillus rhizolycopersici TaxID=2780073 RepID=A0ABS2H3C7_9BACL|nr:MULTISPECIES: sensor histidine kinase [Paenibacillus]MBM6994260.1 sensor histidine kinase [Paenibacillus rhizolycopersici]MUG86629.1 HAMP domain-containing protein [Paenibacillus timonensis]GIP49792.1 histidine kinase [Paenibacillus sp. J53TS2]